MATHRNYRLVPVALPSTGVYRPKPPRTLDLLASHTSTERKQKVAVLRKLAYGISTGQRSAEALR